MASKKTAKPQAEISIESAEAMLAIDGRTDAFCPLAQWSPLDDDRVARLEALAKHASSRQDDRWRIVAARAWLDVTQLQTRSPSKAHTNATAALEAMSDTGIEHLRWRAHADAVLARASHNGRKCYLAAVERYRAVLAKDAADLSARVMAAMCLRLAATSARYTKRWAKEGAPLVTQSLELLGPAPEEDARVLLERGLALESIDRSDEALPILERALELSQARAWAGLDPSSMDLAWKAVPMIHERAGRKEQAFAWWRKHIEAAPARAYDAVTTLAKHLQSASDWAAIVALIDGLPREVPSGSELARLLATAKVNSGDRAGAKAVIEWWLTDVESAWRDDWWMFYLLGLCERSLDDKPAAARAFDRAMELTPDNPTVFPILVWNLFELGEHARCADLCGRAMPLRSNDKNVLHTFAAALHALGQHDEAKPLLRRAHALGDQESAGDLQRWYGETP